MPVICPTCQIPPGACSICASTYLFKALNGRRAIPGRRRFRRPGNRRRTYPGGGLLLSSALGRCGAADSRPRSGPPYSPGMRDRRTCGISNDRTRHRTHGAQNDGARDSAHRSTTGSTLSLCFERNQRRCDRRRNQQYLHRDSPVSPADRTPKLRRHEGPLPLLPDLDRRAIQKAHARFSGAGLFLSMMTLCR